MGSRPGREVPAADIVIYQVGNRCGHQVTPRPSKAISLPNGRGCDAMFAVSVDEFHSVSVAAEHVSLASLPRGKDSDVLDYVERNIVFYPLRVVKRERDYVIAHRADAC